MAARAAIGLLQGGRAAIGAALLAAPVAAGEPWVGEPRQRPAVRSRCARSAPATSCSGSVRCGPHGAGARRGGGLVHGARRLDVVDGIATGSMRSELPSGGVPVMALAFGAAAAGLALAATSARPNARAAVRAAPPRRGAAGGSAATSATLRPGASPTGAFPRPSAAAIARRRPRGVRAVCGDRVREQCAH